MTKSLIIHQSNESQRNPGDILAKLKSWAVVRDREHELDRQRRDTETQRRANEAEAAWKAARQHHTDEAEIDQKAAREAMLKALDEYEPPEPEPEASQPTDDALADRLQDKIAELTRLVSEQANTIESLRDQLIVKSLRTSLPFHRTLDDVVDRIVKLRADFFRNEGGKKGRSRYKLTLFVWLDNKDAKAGNIKALTFPLTYDPKRQEFSGSLLWKGMVGGIKGSKAVSDHICLVSGNQCHVAVGGREIELDEFDAEPDGLAIKRWYWNADKALSHT
jgi:hypothetical protein